jgi:hypothetical protein
MSKLPIVTVGDLRAILQDAPDDMPVLVYAGRIGPADGEVYWSDYDGCDVFQISMTS